MFTYFFKYHASWTFSKNPLNWENPRFLLVDNFWWKNPDDPDQVGGWRRPMEPEPTVRKPHCNLLQWQGRYSYDVYWEPNVFRSWHLTFLWKVEVYQWTEGDFVVDEPIKGHTRQVTMSQCHFNHVTISTCQYVIFWLFSFCDQVSDLHWNTREPPLLASSSLDGNIHVWDIRSEWKPELQIRATKVDSREPRKPAQSFQTIVGASHIRWSRGDCTYLARYSVHP